jgi:hypothetical protein
LYRYAMFNFSANDTAACPLNKPKLTAHACPVVSAPGAMPTR